MIDIVYAVIGTCLIAGCLIGAIGIGGVIIVPILVYWLDIPIQIAISAAMSGYIITGIIGTFIYAQEGSIRWRLAVWICLGSIPGVVLGSYVSNTVDPRILKFAIGLLTLSSALSNIVRQAQKIREKSSKCQSISPHACTAIGGFTGLLSALTGTGGPVVLIPLLTWLRLPTLMVIGLSQAVQIPIAVFGTASNLAYGSFDLKLSLALASTLALGTWIGAKASHIISTPRLSLITTIVLFTVGMAIVLEIIYRLL